MVVDGTVINHPETIEPGWSYYSVVVRTEFGEIDFRSNLPEIKKYKNGDRFNHEMTLGFWGLLSKEK